MNNKSNLTIEEIKGKITENFKLYLNNNIKIKTFILNYIKKTHYNSFIIIDNIIPDDKIIFNTNFKEFYERLFINNGFINKFLEEYYDKEFFKKYICITYDINKYSTDKSNSNYNWFYEKLIEIDVCQCDIYILNLFFKSLLINECRDNYNQLNNSLLKTKREYNNTIRETTENLNLAITNIKDEVKDINNNFNNSLLNIKRELNIKINENYNNHNISINILRNSHRTLDISLETLKTNYKKLNNSMEIIKEDYRNLKILNIILISFIVIKGLLFS